jgi:hypothetical protein
MKIQEINPNLLKPYNLNAKLHPPEQIEKIIRSINLSGFDQPIVANKEGDELILIKGHGRLLASLQMGLKSVPVIVTELPKLIADQARLMDNKSSESDYDLEILLKELSKFNSEELAFTGFNESELNALIHELEDKLALENYNWDQLDNSNYDNDKEDDIEENKAEDFITIEAKFSISDFEQVSKTLSINRDTSPNLIGGAILKLCQE